MKKLSKTLLTLALVLMLTIPVLCFSGCGDNSKANLVMDRIEFYFQTEPDIKSYSTVKIGAISGNIDEKEVTLDTTAQTEYEFYKKSKGVVTTYTKENPLVITTGSVNIETGSQFTLTFNSPKVITIESGFSTAYDRDAVKTHSFTVPEQEGYSNESVFYEGNTNGFIIYIRFHFSSK